MVLCGTLDDKGIARRDKMRDAIITQWRDSFEQLKSDLSVSYIQIFLFSLLTVFDIEILWTDQFHFRRLVKREPGGLLSVNCPLDLM